MKTDDYMLKLYEMKGHLQGLAMTLERAGLVMAAEEIDREADELGVRTAQIEAVLQEYQIDIAIAQRAQQPPRFIGVEMAAQDKNQTFTTKVQR